MIISFYTSRVVLQQLGVEDYGIYSVVGSIVAMFSSLRVMFSSSTQRFLNYEIGIRSDKLQTVFNTSLRVNIMISVLFVILAEIVGYWFLNYKMNVPIDRLFATKVVFQLSVITTVFHIVQTTYDAVIIAHEKMQFYAYMSLIEAILKLVIVYVLSISVFDKLIFYALLLLVVSLLILIIDIIYCWWNYPESHVSILKDKSYYRKMTAFAGWNFLGNSAYALSTSGQSMILNIFGGPILNAARGLAAQVNSALSQVTSNINIVVSPFCVKSYASKDYAKMYSMVYLSSKILFTIQLCIVVPFVFLTSWLLEFWLGGIPEYSVVFLQLVMAYSLFRSIHGPIDTIFKACGKLKYYQICEGIMLSLPIFLSYFALQHEAPYYSLYVIAIICEILNYCIIIPLAGLIVGLPILTYLKNVILPCVIVSVCPIVLYTMRLQTEKMVWALLITILAIIMSIALMWVIGMDRNEKEQIKSIVKR